MRLAPAPIIFVVLTCARLASAASPLTDLGATLGPKAGVLALNDAGVMDGAIPGNAKDQTRAAIFQDGKPKVLDLGGLGGRMSVAHRINNVGVLVGMADTAGNQPHAFLYTPSAGAKDLGTLGGAYSMANDVNDAGVVVGRAEDEERRYLPFRWRGGAMEQLKTPAGAGTGGTANGINSRGDVVGGFHTTPQLPKTHAFLLRPGRAMQDLGTLGGANSEASRINDNGLVIGWSDLPGDAERHAFRCDAADGKLVDLGVFPGDARSGAYAINNANVIVGTSARAKEEDVTRWRAVAWLPQGALVDLTAWLRKTDPPTGKRWRLGMPAAINSSNHVLGYGHFDADNDGKFESPRPFLLDISALMKSP